MLGLQQPFKFSKNSHPFVWGTSPKAGSRDDSDPEGPNVLNQPVFFRLKNHYSDHYSDHLVVGLELFFPIIYGIILPIDEYFSRWLKPPTSHVWGAKQCANANYIYIYSICFEIRGIALIKDWTKFDVPWSRSSQDFAVEELYSHVLFKSVETRLGMITFCDS